MKKKKSNPPAEKVKPGLLSWMAQGYRPYFFLALICFLLFFQALHFDFTFLDDYPLITKNKDFLSSLSNVPQAFSQSVFSMLKGQQDNFYRPLLTLTFFVDYHFSGLSPVAYHFTNILLHALATCLLFRLLTLFRFRREHALLLSFVFLAHPALATAVGWIPGRNDSLLTIFALASFITLAQFCFKRKTGFLIAHFLFLFLALLTKETAWLFPVLYVLFLWTIQTRFNTQKISAQHKSVIAAGWIVVFGIYFAMRMHALSAVPAPEHQQFAQVAANATGIVQYLGKLVFPFNLSTYPLLQDTTYLFGIAAIILFALLFFTTQKKVLPFQLLILAWILLSLAPTMIGENLLEHRLYFPAAGLMLWLGDRFFPSKQKIARYVVPVFVALAFVFCALSFVHTSHCRNQESYWGNALENNPHSALAWTQAGENWVDKNNFDSAQIYFAKALSINPEEPTANGNLGFILLKKGRENEAEPFLREEIYLNPGANKAYAHLAEILFEKDSLDEAERLLRKSLDLDPGYADALIDLGDVLGKKGESDEAIALWKKAITSDPGNVLPYKNIFMLLEYEGKDDEAMPYRNKLIQMGIPVPVIARDTSSRQGNPNH